MKILYTILSAFIFGLILPFDATAQNEWPRTIESDGRVIKVYQWQPESFSDGSLKASAAISVTENGKNEPAFGMIWLTAGADDNGQQIAIRSVDVTAIKFPNESDANVLADLQTTIAQGISGWNLSIPSDEINNSLQVNREEEKLSGNFNNTPPRIMYADKPSLMVVIDGSPKLQKSAKWGAETVVNTPFTIVKNNSKFYLYGGKHWYIASSATGPYAITTNIPGNLEKIQSEIMQANKENKVQQEDKDYVISNIIVSTEPAELLQSDGEPNFTPIPETNLLYIRNSGNDIFMDVSSQQYYVLLSGRWYKSTALSGKWNYVAADRLPEDFAKIPEGSAKDNVLASVAGTVAAKDAVMDAQVPQTAKVDRNKAAADIQYDGDPQFDDIEGTEMAYAINTPDYVIRWRGSYYAVDNGVWFHSYNPNGPWIVSVDRPHVISYIPPRYPVYAMKYVYIYDVTPDFVYMGYSRGYLNSFVYGPTVVYGTGYYYRPWYGHHYYARPYTWGFNMHYNPWAGWGFGFNYNMGWFQMSVGNYTPWGGWWGPSLYRPSYYPSPYYGGYRRGYYGSYGYRSRNTVIVNNNINVYRNNNIYNYRNDVVTRDNRRIVSYDRNRPGSRPDGRIADRSSIGNRGNATRPANRGNITAPDRQSGGQQPSVRPERRTPATTTERQESSVRPERRVPATTVDSQQPSERPERRAPVVVPERQQPSVRPERRSPVAAPERQQPSVRPERRTPVTAPERQQPSVRPERRSPATAPVRQQPSVPERREIIQRSVDAPSRSAPTARPNVNNNSRPSPAQSGSRPERR